MSSTSGSVRGPERSTVFVNGAAAQLARHYRDQEGLSIAEISRDWDAHKRPSSYLYDPTGDKARASRRATGGVCRDCGGVHVRHGTCAAKAPLICIPGAAGRNSKGCSWVQWLTRIRKVKGTIACQESGGHAQVSGVRRRGTRVIWRKLDCLKPNLQKMKRRIRSPECNCPAPCSAMAFLQGRRNLRGMERCPVRVIKEMSRTPKSRSDVRQGRTRDQPSRRESQGDGVPIVVVGVATHQGGRESRPQGEGAQVAGPLVTVKGTV